MFAYTKIYDHVHNTAAIETNSQRSQICQINAFGLKGVLKLAALSYVRLAEGGGGKYYKALDPRYNKYCNLIGQN